MPPQGNTNAASPASSSSLSDDGTPTARTAVTSTVVPVTAAGAAGALVVMGASTTQRRPVDLGTTVRGVQAPSTAAEVGGGGASAGGKVTTDEERAVGSVRSWVVLAYISANGLALVAATLLLSIAASSLSVAGSFWISTWSGAELSAYLAGAPAPTAYYLNVYVGLGIASVVASAVRGISLAYGRVNASRTLHAALLARVLAAPVFWYDTTPLGRILNRFSVSWLCVCVYTQRNGEAWSVLWLLEMGRG